LRNIKPFFLLGIVLALSGCGGGSSGGGTTNQPASPIVGTWRLTRVRASGFTLNCPGSLSVPGVGSAACTDREFVTYNRDGTFTATGNLTVSGIDLPGSGAIPTNASGTYSLNDDQLTVNVTDPLPDEPEPVTIEAVFSNSNRTLTLTTVQEDVTVVSTFAKQ
jgi:hypothetical protein